MRKKIISKCLIFVLILLLGTTFSVSTLGLSTDKIQSMTNNGSILYVGGKKY